MAAKMKEKLWILGTHLESLCYDWNVFQLPSPLLPPVYWSFGSDETINFFLSKHINTWNGLFMALLVLYEVHEQTVWTKNIRFKASDRQRKGEERKMVVHFLFIQVFLFPCPFSYHLKWCQMQTDSWNRIQA